MIDWWLVGSASLWITGLTVLLAALSYHQWFAQELGEQLRNRFKTRSWNIHSSLGMVLFCAGLAVARSVLSWERVLWGTFTLYFA